MREVVEQILTSKYDYEKATLDFSCAKVEIELVQGEVSEGSFTIYAPEGKYTKGFVTSTDPRMECLTTEFAGSNTQIQFCFHGEWMAEGEVVRGEFEVVSNRGEYYLPFVVSVVYSVPDSSVGPIKNLFHFANLAKTNWREAVKLFYSVPFEKLMKGGEEQVYLNYLGLSAREGNEQCVEEFLITTNKKQPVEYVPSKKKLILDAPAEVVEEDITIYRNGWGFTRLEVMTEGDFLFTEKAVITEDDFLGNYYSLPVYIDSVKLHAGKNFGTVTLKSAYAKVEIPVEINHKAKNAGFKSKERARKKHILKLMGFYERFRLKKMSSAAWIKETVHIIDKLVAIDEKDAATRLFQAQMLITCERYNEAGWILEHVGDLIYDNPAPALEAYYLYLNTLLKRDEFYTKDITEKVTRIYLEHGEDWRVAWLMLFMSGEYNRGPVERWNFLERQFENGCRSPLIYVEAMQQLVANPTLLRKLGSFELQVLNYGTKKGMVSLEVLDQILYLTERVKEFSNVLFTILCGCFEKKQDVRVLKEICTLLIKGNKVGKKYFEWYEKGVAKELRILNIYEYFMLSMDLSKEPDIPKQALLYFTYQNNMDYEHSAYLYYYISKNRARFLDIFEGYRKKIEFFAIEQLQKKHINTRLAYLYEEFIREDMLTLPLAQAMAQVLYCKEISPEKQGIRSVILRHAGFTKEQMYPVVNDRTYAPVYSLPCAVLLEDIQGNRYVKSVTYQSTRLMKATEFESAVAEVVTDDVLLDLHLYESKKNDSSDSESKLQRRLRLLENTGIPQEKKRELVLRIMDTYYASQDHARLEEYLDTLSGEWMTAGEQAAVIRYLVLCKNFDKAYAWLVTYRNSEVDDKILLHLLESRMEEKGAVWEKELLGYAYVLFCKGKYSSNLISYLMEHYQGLLRNLREIWKASKHYDLDRRAFCERIVMQILFSGMYIGEQTEIFKEYVYCGADARVEEAYLVKNGYDYFVSDLIIPQELLTEIGRLHKEGNDLNVICKLAYLKYYADNREEIQDADKEIIGDFISDMLQMGIHLNCMVELRQFSGHQMFLADKTVIEYQAIGDGTIRLHYLLMKGNDETGEYVTEGMEPAVGKLYTKEFVLFGGESLQYYVTEEFNGVERLTESGTCRRSEEMVGETAGKYALINDIILSKSMQDDSTFDSLVEEYYKKKFYNQTFFRWKD